MKQRIEDALYETGYHPEFAQAANEELERQREAFTEAGQPKNMTPALQSQRMVAVLMQQKYFAPRLKFLAGLVSHVEQLPSPHVDIAEDGCGTGMDLYVLQKLLGEKVRLTGIDINEAALDKARQRVPQATLATAFAADANEAYDVVYADYVSIDDNSVQALSKRGREAHRVLRPGGTVLHNADMLFPHLYRIAFGAQFSRTLPSKLLDHIQGGPSSYLFRYEKE